MRPRISSKPVRESYDPSIRNITSRLFESVRKDAETKETCFCAGSSSYSNIPSYFNHILKYNFYKPKHYILPKLSVGGIFSTCLEASLKKEKIFCLAVGSSA